MTAATAERVLTGLIRSLEGTYVRVFTNDGQALVGRLEAKRANDPDTRLRLIEWGGQRHTVDLADVDDVMSTSDVPF